MPVALLEPVLLDELELVPVPVELEEPVAVWLRVPVTVEEPVRVALDDAVPDCVPVME